MMIPRRLLMQVALRVARDPRVRAKVTQTYQEVVQPTVATTARQLRRAARDAPPLRDPAAFARAARTHLFGNQKP
ncbi:MAG: hypothetical protein ACTS3R_18690 [Inquilinaceae bacterium]